ncbi:LOW QUALITY PROTEIN: hypothetical protein PHMEG_0004246 [Phytophthora megakarya]|uniref:Uncharacterized protein n=1 Tax=Phytophthora megakarya TaxID=4795 RepID=A0A225WUE4_9STRA|nr:LOW QUALITY PROTEIN: hypothetical protein PHMEG_0004246 [Phytophthora megakarya]
MCSGMSWVPEARNNLTHLIGCLLMQLALKPRSTCARTEQRVRSGRSPTGDASQLTTLWSQVAVPPTLHKIYSSTSSAYSICPLQNLHGDNTQQRGGGGARSARASGYRFGRQNGLLKDNPYSWLSSAFTAGAAVYRYAELQLTPFSPSLTTFAGNFMPMETWIRNSLPVTTSHSPRIRRPPNSREPVYRRSARMNLARLDFNKDQQRVIGGAVLLGIFFLLRSAESLAVRGAWQTNTLQVWDIVVWDQWGGSTTCNETVATVE